MDKYYSPISMKCKKIMLSLYWCPNLPWGLHTWIEFISFGNYESLNWKLRLENNFI